jgi:hypothetical protein
MGYNIKYTDTQKTTIPVEDGKSISNVLDIELFGNVDLEYGEKLNENLLHILQNFACPEMEVNPGNPDLVYALDDLLLYPTEGQLWFNSTQNHLYFWDGTEWKPLAKQEDIAANWGRIEHGQQLPKPVSATTGYVFDYDECIWSVSPANFTSIIDYMVCATDEEARVTMQFLPYNEETLVKSVANYLIIGIRGNTNGGSLMSPPAPSPTPTPTPSPSTVLPTPTATAAVSPTPVPPEFAITVSSNLLSGECDISLVSPSTTGIICGPAGAADACSGGSTCAPNGSPITFSASGGVEPYYFEVLYNGFTNNLDNASDCFRVVPLGAHVLNTVTSTTTTSPETVLTDFGGNTTFMDGDPATLQMRGNCSSDISNGFGTLKIRATDNAGLGTTITKTISWSFDRYNGTPAVSPPAPMSIDVVGGSLIGACDIDNHMSSGNNDTGVNCGTGLSSTCDLGTCAPDSANGTEGGQTVTINISNGTAPYTINVYQYSGASSLNASDCFYLTAGGQTTYNGVDQSSTNELLISKQTADTSVVLSMLGNCATDVTDISGQIRVVVTDAELVEDSAIIPWEFIRNDTYTEVPLSMTSVDYYDNNRNLYMINTECNVFIHPEGDGGHDCLTGGTEICPEYSCAPEPGDEEHGRVPYVTVTGGIEPYYHNFEFVDFTVDNELPLGECLNLGTNNDCTIYSSSTPGQELCAPSQMPTENLLINAGGSCGTNIVYASGHVKLIISDSGYGTHKQTITKTYSFSYSRDNYNPNPE